MARRIADIPAIEGLPIEARRIINDRLQRIEQQFGTAGAAGVTIEQVNAQIAGLAARVSSQIAAAKQQTAGADAPTAQGGQVVLSIPGMLAIESNAAPLVTFKAGRQVTEVELLVKQAPTGADLEVRVLVDGATAATVKLLAGQTSVKAAASFAIAAGKTVRIDILAVGLTIPGADLSVILRY